LEELTTYGTTADKVTVMTRAHSEDLRERGEVWADGKEENVGSLYKEHDLDQTCKFKNNAGGSILTPGYDARFLAVQQVDVTTANESQLADHIVDEWLNSLEHDDKFDYEHATRLGTGVAIDEWSGKAYVATSVC